MQNTFNATEAKPNISFGMEYLNVKRKPVWNNIISYNFKDGSLF